MDPVLLLRLAYGSATLAVLFIAAAPPLSSRFLVYGARASSASTDAASKAPSRNASSGVACVDAALDWLAEFTVPHAWFTSFYALSVACSMFWAGEIVSKGSTFYSIAALIPSSKASMSLPQLELVWGLMVAQGSRRLYECLAMSRPSASRMWIGHWVLGVAFYAATSIAVWIEGAAMLGAHRFALHDVAIVAPSLRSSVGILIFILASGLQHDCHAYLSSLKDKQKGEYRLPDHPAFHSIVAPHYTAECAIYLALALIAAPKGAWINGTLLCALIFVVVNLGVTAGLTKRWYAKRFGEAAVTAKWRMIPGIY